MTEQKFVGIKQPVSRLFPLVGYEYTALSSLIFLKQVHAELVYRTGI